MRHMVQHYCLGVSLLEYKNIQWILKLVGTFWNSQIATGFTWLQSQVKPYTRLAGPEKETYWERGFTWLSWLYLTLPYSEALPDSGVKPIAIWECPEFQNPLYITLVDIGWTSNGYNYPRAIIMDHRSITLTDTTALTVKWLFWIISPMSVFH